MTQRFIFSFEIVHDNQIRLKICHHFSFTSNKSRIQKNVLFTLFSTGSLVTQKLSLERQMLWTWNQRWNILLPKLDNICKNQVSSIFQYLVVFKGLIFVTLIFDVFSTKVVLKCHRWCFLRQKSSYLIKNDTNDNKINISRMKFRF